MPDEAIETQGEPELFARTSGEQLKLARERMKLSVEDVADRTRIAARQIEAIEAGRLQDLPGRTYAIGFSRTYATLVGENVDQVLDKVRAELSQIEPAYQPGHAHHLEPGDPARIPPRGLAWPLAIGALLLLIGGYVFYQTFLAPSASSGAPEQQETAPPAAAVPAPDDAPPAAGPVVFTAREDGVWVRFYERGGERLLEKTLARGESYTVPADAADVLLNTGRPDALDITIGGKSVPRLAESPVTLGDVAVNAQALLDRDQAAPEPSSSPTT